MRINYERTVKFTFDFYGLIFHTFMESVNEIDRLSNIVPCVYWK